MTDKKDEKKVEVAAPADDKKAVEEKKPDDKFFGKLKLTFF
jgi:hypothetical protein